MLGAYPAYPLISELAAGCQLNVMIGPPGTGKTTETGASINTAVSQGWEPLVASLTRAAARELVGRELEIDDGRIGTLHAHAYAALDGPTIAEAKLKEWNAYVTEQHLSDGWRIPEAYGKKPRLLDPNDVGGSDPEKADERTPGLALLEASGVYRARMVPPDHWPSVEIRAWFAAWQAWKSQAGYVDFTDLLEGCLEQGLRPRVPFDALYLDEAQDMSRLEMTLALTWASDARAVLVVGDPRQNLYEWRGSEPTVLREMWDAAKRTKVLAQSYRVPRAVHRQAMRWVAMLDDGMDADYLPRPADGRVRFSGPALGETALLANELARRSDAGETVMLLAACDYQLRPVLARLREMGVPFHNPYRTHHGGWNPLLYARKPTSMAGSVLAFSRVDDRVWGDQARFWTPAELRGWADKVKAEAFLRGVKSEIAGLQDGATIDPDWLAERVPELADLEAIFSGDPAWLAQRATAAKANGLRYPIAVARRGGPPMLEATPRLIVGTIHSVKGGEADVVYLAPDLSPAGFDEWSGSERDRIIRQFYVGMTRAREELVLLAPASPRSVHW